MLLLLKYVELLLQRVLGPVSLLLSSPTRVVLGVLVDAAAAGEVLRNLVGVPHLRQEAPL